MISIGRELVTEIRVGNDPVGQVMHVGMEVWPNKPIKPVDKRWIARLFDKLYPCTSGLGWAIDIPDLSKFPNPVKGCIALNFINNELDHLVAALCIFDGSQWIEDQAGWEGSNNIIAKTGKPVDYAFWFNEPNATTVAQDWFDNNPDLSNALTALFCAEADGVHIVIFDAEGNRQIFVNPWPTGFTPADLPPTKTDNFI